MRIQDLIARMSKGKPRATTNPRNFASEHDIQAQCVHWFRATHAAISPRLFAVPNGGQRSIRTAAMLKEEGLMPGVSDLILLVPNSQYHALLIEMKTPVGQQSPAQKAWQRHIEQDNHYKYIIIRSFEQFKQEINAYLS